MRILRGRQSDEPLGEIAVGVDAAIAQKRPVSAAEFHPREITIRHQHLFAIDRPAGHDRSVRGGDERLTPELDPIRMDRLTIDAVHDLVPDSVGRAHETAVGHRVTTLDELP